RYVPPGVVGHCRPDSRSARFYQRRPGPWPGRARDATHHTSNTGSATMIHFGPEICHNLEAALQREWLETNGLGGFASSTILGLNTRRYHSLLTAITKPPVGRLVLLAKLEETLIVDGQ